MPPYAKNHRAQDYPDKDNKNIYFALLDLVPFVQFKTVKNTHGGTLLLVQIY